MKKLKVARLGIKILPDLIIYLRHDCDICDSKGFEAENRLLVTFEEKLIFDI